MGASTDGKPITSYAGSWADAINDTAAYRERMQGLAWLCLRNTTVVDTSRFQTTGDTDDAR